MSLRRCMLIVVLFMLPVLLWPPIIIRSQESYLNEYKAINLTTASNVYPHQPCLLSDSLKKSLVESINPSEPLVLMSWNVQKGLNIGWRKDLKTLLNNSDIALLQEAVFTEPFVGAIDLPYRIIGEGYRSRRGMTGVLTASSVLPSYSCTFRDREPLLRTQKASAIVELPIENTDKKLLVANIHAVNFSWGLASFKAQLQRLINIIKEHNGPVIFAGDFNTWRGARHTAVNKLMSSVNLREIEFDQDYRTRMLGNTLDNIYVRGFNVVSAQSLPYSSSDHNPLRAVLKFKE